MVLAPVPEPMPENEAGVERPILGDAGPVGLRGPASQRFGSPRYWDEPIGRESAASRKPFDQAQ